MRKDATDFRKEHERQFTIWEFRGVTIPQKVVVAKPTEPAERAHEYQAILARVMALNAKEALSLHGVDPKAEAR